MKQLRSYLLTVSLLGLYLSAQAHHTNVHLDRETVVELTGTVIAYRYTNPHIHVDFESVDENGLTETWRIEMQSPIILRRFGWDRNSFSVGERITVEAHPSRNDSVKLLEGLRFTKSDGTTLGTSAQFEEDDPAGLPSIDVDVVRVPAQTMAGVWDLGFRHGRFGPPSILYDPPSDELRASYPYVHPSMFRFIPVLNDSGLEVLSSFRNSNPDNPWCSADPFFISHYTENRLVEIILEDDAVIFRRPDADLLVHFDEAPPPAEQQFTWGFATGRWEGETLHIEVTNFEPNPWGLGRGLSSGSRKVVSHTIYWQEDRTELYMDTTLFDPEFMAEPLAIESTLVHSPHRQLPEPVECSLESAYSHLEALQ